MLIIVWEVEMSERNDGQLIIEDYIWNEGEDFVIILKA